MTEDVARLGKAGRLVIPAKIRRALDLHPGDELLLRVENDGLHLSTRAQAVARAQAIVRKYVAPNRSLSDELIAERREDAERE
jgi:AbrB family looped-hinge helix DNA binding protein